MRNTKSRLGCLSGTGLIAAVITLLAITGYVYAKGGLLYNPGPLNAQRGEMIGGVTSHAETGGDCKACHTAPWESERMDDRCADCHSELAAQIQDVGSMHGKMMNDAPDLRCRNCHLEHRGPDAPLTVMNGAEFPHEVTGYSLDGHQTTVTNEAFVCFDCHGDDVSRFDPQVCDTCHRQVDTTFMATHTESYGSICLDCHDGVDSLVSGFDHNEFSFKLTGEHREPSCVQCHNVARKLGDFQSISQDCYSCHRSDDWHNGQYGTDCAMCHGTNGWEPANFDHNLSNFKLEGEHGEAACEDCHQNGVFVGTPSDCYSCHQQDDEHNGRFGTDCSACHNPSDWDDADFHHNKSNSPLTGRHVDTPCEPCHTNVHSAGLSSTCLSCHADPVVHAGMFGTECASCHTTVAWLPAEYNGPHVFPINHEGAGNDCQLCHPGSLLTYTCYGCHEHTESNVAVEHREEGISNYQNCIECHWDGREHEGGDGGGGEGGDDD